MGGQHEARVGKQKVSKCRRQYQKPRDLPTRFEVVGPSPQSIPRGRLSGEGPCRTRTKSHVEPGTRGDNESANIDFITEKQATLTSIFRMYVHYYKKYEAREKRSSDQSYRIGPVAVNRYLALHLPIATTRMQTAVQTYTTGKSKL